MIDLVKKYQTRAGRKVRVYATDGDGPYPVHGAEWVGEGWTTSKWTQDGGYCSGAITRRDLIEVREKLTVSGHVNIYRINGDATLLQSELHRTKEDAIYARRNSPDAIACRPVTIEFEEGDGL